MTDVVFIAAGLGLAIGAIMGGFGAGGSVLTVPALIYLLGQQPLTATTASLVIVGLMSVSGVVPHALRGMVRWRQGLLFGALGSLGALLGTRLAVGADQDLLLLAFSGLILVAAIAMVKQRGPDAGTPPATTAGEPPTAGRAPADPEPDVAAGRGRASRRPASLVRIVPAALGLGLLTGVFGVGGGFATVPALVLILGAPMPQAVGTSLVITMVNSGAALAARVGAPVDLDWSVLVPFAAFAVLGTVPGAWLTNRLPVRTLTRVFAVLLVAVALGVGTAAARSLG
ncbi:MAG: uncharacterized protein QG608_2328 [Actinomycetota bacterium]|nr:uncharacterized protein [Actinomycetota bacterium]